MAATKTTRRTMKLTDLKEHPKQQAMFGDLPDAELRALAADIKANGMRVPVEVLPDGTIITGHQRARAAKLLGWTEIAVNVRHDLAEAGAAATEAAFIADNLNRRHLSPLGKAACIKRLIELEAGCRTGGLSGRQADRLKAVVAERMGLSPRSVNRYLLILKCPVAVQQAFDRGDLTLTEAGKVALLSSRLQEEVARRITAGEKPKTVLADKLDVTLSDHAARGEFDRLISSLIRKLPKLMPKVREIAEARRHRSLELLRTAHKLLADVLKAATRKAG